MLFLSILLNIIKIIGIIILVLLGIVILLLCLLLFVPIRYKVHAGYHGKINVTAHVTYLLRLLHVRFEMDGSQSELQICLFGHDISGKKKKPERAEAAHKKKAPGKGIKESGPQEITTPQENATPKVKTQTTPTEKTVSPMQESAGRPEKSADDTGTTHEKKDAPAHDKESKSTKKEKKKNTNTDTGGIIDNIKTITNLLKENRSVLKFVFRQLKLLFGHILPGSHVIVIRLGLDDPAMLGEILGAAAVVRASTGLVICINPVWDETVFEADADLKGRIILGRVLYIAARVYFNKDVRKLINAVKK